MAIKNSAIWCIAAAVLLTACSNSATQTPDPSSPSTPAASRTGTVPSGESARVFPSGDATSQVPADATQTTQTDAPTATETDDPAVTEPVGTALPQILDLKQGETAHLSSFDVTFVKSQVGADTVTMGWQVKVCYTHAYEGANADGTTRVSRDPWQIQVRDGESGNDWQWVPVTEYTAGGDWKPAYTETQLKVGQCQEGWIGIKHGNPDLQWGDLRYQSTESGDMVTWKVS